MESITLNSLHNAIIDTFLRFDLLAMDIYTIARIFREFDTDGVTTFQPKLVSNIIVYTGVWHMENYEKFFEFMSIPRVETTSPLISNQPLVSGSQPTDVRCTDMTGITQPLFSLGF